MIPASGSSSVTSFIQKQWRRTELLTCFVILIFRSLINFIGYFFHLDTIYSYYYVFLRCRTSVVPLAVGEIIKTDLKELFSFPSEETDPNAER